MRDHGTALHVATVFAALALATCAALAQNGSHQTLQVMLGDAYNFDSHLHIQQAGEANLDFTAEWDTAGSGAPYYDLRFGWWDDDRAQEAEHLHHKIELTNNPPEVAEFRIGYGLNMLMYNRAWRESDWIQRVGAGLAVTHAVNTVRGLAFADDGWDFPGGYRLSGACAQYGIERRWPIGGDWFFSAEAKGTVAWVEVPVVNGRADLWNYALHGLAGVGYRFD